MKTRANRLLLRVAGGAFISFLLLLEGGCASGGTTGASSSAPAVAAYEKARITAWDSSRRFKALFKAEVSPKIGAVGRGYFSVWWDGASGSLAWRASAPIAGSGRGGLLQKGREGGDAESASPLPGRLAAADLIACILGTPDAAPSSSTVLDEQGRVIEMRFAKGEVVSFQPGEGVPRRIEAKVRGGQAVLVLESYGPWPENEEVPPL